MENVMERLAAKLHGVSDWWQARFGDDGLGAYWGFAVTMAAIVLWRLAQDL